MKKQWEVIDTTTGEVVSTHDTCRKAFNATNRLEPMPSKADPAKRWGNEWRYLIRRGEG